MLVVFRNRFQKSAFWKRERTTIKLMLRMCEIRDLAKAGGVFWCQVRRLRMTQFEATGICENLQIRSAPIQPP